MSGVLALIPARSGSKGLKGKNGLPLGGLPLISYSIAAAKQSRRVDRVICSTDGEFLAELARSHGAEVPFLRPPELAEDDTRDLPVFQHALRWLREKENWTPDIVVQLRPTSPLRKPGQIDRAVELLESNPRATAVRTVCVPPCNPFKMWSWSDKSQSPFMKNLLDVEGVKEPFNEPRQNLPPTWWQTGTIDVVRSSVIQGGSMTGDRLLPMEVDANQGEDIDSELNLIYAGMILESGGFIRPDCAAAWSGVRLLVLDVDGILTPGTLYYSESGDALKRIQIRDARGIELLREKGIRTMIMTSEDSKVSKAIAGRLGLDLVVAGRDDRVSALERILDREGLTTAQVCYMGNDLGDLAAVTRIAASGGMACAVADAVGAVKRAANFHSSLNGGCGAVREVCDRILLHAK